MPNINEATPAFLIDLALNQVQLGKEETYFAYIIFFKFFLIFKCV